MPRTQCVVPQCKNRGGHIIPANKERRAAWIHAIKRGETKFTKWEPPSKYSYICSCHFTDDDYVSVTYHGML